MKKIINLVPGSKGAILFYILRNRRKENNGKDKVICNR